MTFGATPIERCVDHRHFCAAAEKPVDRALHQDKIAHDGADAAQMPTANCSNTSGLKSQRSITCERLQRLRRLAAAQRLSDAEHDLPDMASLFHHAVRPHSLAQRKYSGNWRAHSSPLDQRPHLIKQAPGNHALLGQREWTQQ